MSAEEVSLEELFPDMRPINSTYLVPIALGRGQEMRKAVLAHEDVRRAMKLIAQWCESTDLVCSPWAWAMLRDTQAEVLDKVVKFVTADEVLQLESEIDRKISPLSASYAFDAYWRMLALGDEAQGLNALKQCQSRSVAMPFELP